MRRPSIFRIPERRRADLRAASPRCADPGARGTAGHPGRTRRRPARATDEARGARTSHVWTELARALVPGVRRGPELAGRLKGGAVHGARARLARRPPRPPARRGIGPGAEAEARRRP